MMQRIQALRGAVNFESDTAKEIDSKSEELFKELLKQNNIELDDIVCVIFSLTKDITAAYPAKTFREKISQKISLFSCTEPDIEGGMPLTLRVMMLHYGNSNTPVYLYDTKNLRKDLFYEHSN